MSVELEAELDLLSTAIEFELQAPISVECSLDITAVVDVELTSTHQIDVTL